MIKLKIVKLFNKTKFGQIMLNYCINIFLFAFLSKWPFLSLSLWILFVITKDNNFEKQTEKQKNNKGWVSEPRKRKERRSQGLKMGQKGSKDRLTKSDLEFLKSSTRYDEDTIKVRKAKKNQALHDIDSHSHPTNPHHTSFALQNFKVNRPFRFWHMHFASFWIILFDRAGTEGLIQCYWRDRLVT